MKKIFIPTSSAEDWKRFLAEPDKQWRTGYSAKSLAYCWEEANGFPNSVKKIFSQAPFAPFHDMEILFIFPEYQVPLPGGYRPSQSDIFVLAKAQGNLITIAVEGKVMEPFGPTINEWLNKGSTGKQIRLNFLCDQLGVAKESIYHIRYQLLHRTVSSIIEAKRLNACVAVMLVHSFSQNDDWFDDYNAFLNVLGTEGKPNSVTFVYKKDGISIYLAWVTGENRYLEI